MKRLLFTALMARRDRDRGGSSSETPPENPETQTGPITDATVIGGEEPPPETEVRVEGASTNGASTLPPGATLDGEGVINGPGFEQQETPTVDVVHMPTKLVAKDIVGKAALKCTKKWVPVRDASGKEMYDNEGNPLGDWDVTPPRALYVIFGTANGTRTGQSQYGDWTAFAGTFEAQRFADGARFISTEAILQEPAQTLLLNKLEDIKKRDPAGSVQFSFEIGVKTSEKWVTSGQGSSYAYTVKAIFQMDKHDPLAAMRRALLPHLPKPPPPQLKAPEGSQVQS